MSTWVEGFKPSNNKWKKMKAIYDGCEAAGVDCPEEVDKFFGGELPDKAGVRVDLEKSECCKEYNAEMSNGYEIDVTKLPKDVTLIRFVNSY